jgi:hypothetical protein
MEAVSDHFFPVENSEENSAESFLLKIDMENWNFTLKKS